MASKNKKPKRIDTEAAARWVEKNWDIEFFNVMLYIPMGGPLKILIVDVRDRQIVLEVPFSWLYTKRQNLTGVTKRLKAAIRKPKGRK